MKALRWLVLLSLLAVVSGCATSYGPGAEMPDDQQLAADVRSRLSDDDVTGRYSFGIMAENGVVTLRGSVPSDMIRARAIGIVLGTPGVVEVADEILRR